MKCQKAFAQNIQTLFFQLTEELSQSAMYIHPPSIIMGVKELRDMMHKSMRNDKVVFYVSQISGWKTYCSERLKFQGC